MTEEGHAVNKLDHFLSKRYSRNQDADDAYFANLGRAIVDNAQDSDAYKIAIAMAKTYDIVIQPLEGSRDANLLVWDPDKNYHVDLDIKLRYMIVSGMKIVKTKRSMQSLKSDVTEILLSQANVFADEIDNFREPPRYYIRLFDGVFDSRKDAYIDEKESVQYHFTYAATFKRSKQIDAIHQAILDRIFDDWSEGNADKLSVMLNYMRCVIEGDNRGRALAIWGGGGNGKSIYINLCSALLRKESVLHLNIHEAENPFMLEGLGSETRLIAGDELRSNYRFGGEAMSRYKQIIDGQPIKLNMKGRKPITVLPRTCIIQSMNTMMRWDESNAANHDRWISLGWTNTNFRELNREGKMELDFDLDELVKDKSFIDSLFNYVLNKTEYFKHFPVPESIKRETIKQVDESDHVKSYVEYLRDVGALNSMKYLPTNILYEGFLTWMRSESPSAAKMSKRVFTRRIESELVAFGYSLKRGDDGRAAIIRLSMMSNLEFDYSAFSFANISDESFTRQNNVTSYFENPEYHISESDVGDLKAVIESDEEIDLTNRKNIMILKHLIEDVQDILVASKFKDIVDKN